MRFTSFALVAAALCWSPTAAFAQSAPAEKPAADVSERRAAGLKLASLLYSDERQLAATNGPVMDQMEAFFRADPSFATLEAQSPGLIDEVMANMKPLLVEFTISEAPRYRRGVAAVYARHMSVDDIEAATTFYASPLGQKLLDKVGENLSLTSMLGEMSSNLDAPTSERAVTNDLDRTALRAINELSPEEIAEIEEIAGAGWFESIERARPDLVAYDTRFTNEPAPEFESRVEQVVTEILEKRLKPLNN